MNTCKKCGSQLVIGASFCSNCGSPVMETFTSAAQPPIYNSVPNSVPNPLPAQANVSQTAPSEPAFPESASVEPTPVEPASVNSTPVEDSKPQQFEAESAQPYEANKPQAYGAPAQPYEASKPQAYGAPAQSLGSTPAQPYGTKPVQAYGANPAQANGASKPQAYGAPAQPYGANPASTYGSTPAQAYGAPAQPYGNSKPQAYGAPAQPYGSAPGQNPQAPNPNQWGPLQQPKKKSAGGIIAAIIIVVLLLFAALAFLGYTLYKNGFTDKLGLTSSNPYEAPLEYLKEAVNESDSSKLDQAFPLFLLPDSYADELATLYFSNFNYIEDFDYKVNDKTELSEDDLDYYATSGTFTSYSDAGEITITDGYKLDTTISGEYSGVSSSGDITFVVGEINGEWYIIDIQFAS